MGLINWLRNFWKEHQENVKYRELYARLDRNAEGRFTKKKYMQDIKNVTKAEKNRK